MANRSPAARDWTIERLHALPDDGKRHEIIDGAMYVTPSPRPVHQLALALLYDRLQPYASRVGLRVLWSPADLQYGSQTVVQPDLYAFARPDGVPFRSWDDAHPQVLVVEVLSRSTRLRDRTVKRELYQSQRIDEYWIVDVESRTVERWRPDATVVERLTEVLRWQPVPTQPALTIDLVVYFSAVVDG